MTVGKNTGARWKPYAAGTLTTIAEFWFSG
jgi:hypothetical protein